MIKAKKQKNLMSLTLLGWLLIPCWVIFVSVTTHTNFITQALGGLTAENSTLMTALILLAPSALVAVPMTYHSRFSNYFFRKEDAETSSWIARATISLFMTTVILFFVWYMFIVLSFIFY